MDWIARPPGEDEVYHGNAFTPLIDDALWPEVLAAIRRARTTLELTQLLFEPEFTPIDRPLARELEQAAARGVRVRLLVNQNAVVPDSFDELVERFAGTGVDVAGLVMSPNVMHAKVVLVDGETAFLVDAPFEQKYRDTSAHPFQDGRRERKQPFHSVSARLEGPCVARIADVFESLWGRAAGAPLAPLPERPRDAPRRGSQTLQVLWTAPAGYLAPTEDENVLRGYLAALERAERFLYIENQYFTSATLADALRRALDAKPELEVIMVLNPHMDIPGYDTWQRARLQELRAAEHPRLGAFCLWSPRRLARDPAVRHLYVHSKVAIVDDVWATIGSANLDGMSLHTADEFLVPVERNVELNVALLDGVDGAPATGAVADLRRRLWAEHLGDALAWEAERPDGGWLGLWRAIAQDNLRRHEEGRADLQGRVFPMEGMSDRSAAAFERQA